MRYQATVENRLSSVRTSTSRFRICVSSCASTPSNSSISNRSIRPVVTATTELFGPLPVANALGIFVLITATFGFGRLFLATILSIISCNFGNCSLVTTFAPELQRTILSEKYHCAKIITEAITVMEIKSRPTYTSMLRNIIYRNARMAKLRIILAVSPVSLLCHGGFLEIDNYTYNYIKPLLIICLI